MKMIGMSVRSTATRFCNSKPLRPEEKRQGRDSSAQAFVVEVAEIYRVLDARKKTQLTFSGHGSLPIPVREHADHLA
jgi:hypothetical protein